MNSDRSMLFQDIEALKADVAAKDELLQRTKKQIAEWDGVFDELTE